MNTPLRFSSLPATKSPRMFTPGGASGWPLILKLMLAQPQRQRQAVTSACSSWRRKFGASGVPCSSIQRASSYSALESGRFIGAPQDADLSSNSIRQLIALAKPPNASLHLLQEAGVTQERT